MVVFGRKGKDLCGDTLCRGLINYPKKKPIKSFGNWFLLIKLLMASETDLMYAPTPIHYNLIWSSFDISIFSLL